MTGIRVRHARGCGGDPCKCRKSYEAFVFVAREGRKVRSTHKTLAAAKAWRADAMAANNRGKLRTPSPMTVAQAAEEFLAGAKVGTIPSRGGGRYRPATLRGHERSLRLRVLPAIGHMKLGEVRRADLQDLADRMAAEGYTPGTIQNTINAARVLFGRAVQRDLIASDPTERLELRSPDGRREAVAGSEEPARLRAALPDHGPPL